MGDEIIGDDRDDEDRDDGDRDDDDDDADDDEGDKVTKDCAVNCTVRSFRFCACRSSRLTCCSRNLRFNVAAAPATAAAAAVVEWDGAEDAERDGDGQELAEEEDDDDDDEDDDDDDEERRDDDDDDNDEEGDLPGSNAFVWNEAL